MIVGTSAGNHVKWAQITATSAQTKKYFCMFFFFVESNYTAVIGPGIRFTKTPTQKLTKEGAGESFTSLPVLTE